MSLFTDSYLPKLEDALAQNDVWVRLYTNGGNGPVRYWKVRRNGQTKRWKTRPDNFRIPIKFGLYGYGTIEQSNKVVWGYANVHWRNADFIVSEIDPNTVLKAAPLGSFDNPRPYSPEAFDESFKPVKSR